MVDVNDAYCHITGYAREELIGSSAMELNLGADPADYQRLVQMLQKEGYVRNVAIQCRMRSGEIRTFLKSMEPIELRGEQCILSLTQDITEHKQTEAQLRKLSRAVEQSPVVVMITDLNGSIEYVNPKFHQLTGYTAEEALGKNPRFLQSGQTSREDYVRLWQTLKSGGEWRGVFINKKKNGEIYWEEAVIAPILDADGQTTHFVAVKEDITERKRAEEEITNLAKFLTENPNPVLQLNEDGVILYANAASQPLLREWGSGVGQMAPEAWRALASQALASQAVQTVDLELERSMLSFTIVPVIDSGYVNFYGMDITGLLSPSQGGKREEGTSRPNPLGGAV